MTIVEQSTERLILRDRPILMLLALLGSAAACLYGVLAPEAAQTGLITLLLAALAIAMLAIAWWYAPWQRIVFDRTAGEVVHHVSRLGRARVHRLPLSAIHRVGHESHWVDHARSYRLVLETDDGPWPLTAIFTGGRHDETETAIRDWLTTPVPPR